MQAVLERQLAVVLPERIAADVSRDDLPVQIGRRAARARGGTDGDPLDGAVVCIRQVRGGGEPQVGAVLIQQQDRANRARQLLFQAQHHALQHPA